MARNPRRIARELDELYAQLPRLRCGGVCHDSCGPIQASHAEIARMERATGRKLSCGEKATCSMLTADRRCGAYDVRPMICRLWGIVETLPCPYGCRPEGGYLTAAEGYALLAEAGEIGGWPPGMVRFAASQMREMAKDAAGRRRVLAAARRTTPVPSLRGREDALPDEAIPIIQVRREAGNPTRRTQ